jgi:hypothetical protein
MWLTTEGLNFLVARQPADYNNATTAFPCLPVNMAKYSSMVAIVQLGALASCCRVYVNAGTTDTAITTAAVGTTGTLFPFNFRLGATTGSATAIYASTADLLTARNLSATSGTVAYDSTASYASTGLGIYVATTSANSNIYVEIKGDDLPAGYPYCAIAVSTPAQSEIFGVTYVMSPKYPMNTMLPACT